MKLLRATCKYLLPAGSINPFSGMPTRETETVFRKPFTPEELKAIVDAARDDDFIRPILITGICTAMRRGDCCLLKWADVDLSRRFITVKTAKTGVTVAIPIFPMLFDELARLRADTRGQARHPHSAGLSACGPAGAASGAAGRHAQADGYVFPEPAAMYEENPDGITWRVRKVFAAAGFKDALPAPQSEAARQAGDEDAEVETREENGAFFVYAIECDNGSYYIGHTDDLRRRWSEHLAGKAAEWTAAHKPVKIAHYEELNSREEAVAREKWLKTGFGRKWLKREIAAGRGHEANTQGDLPAAPRSVAAQAGDAPAAVGGEIHAKRNGGLRRASVRDFHSFRVTWVTLALTAGVPLELVQKVTGHKTVDVVLKHYYQPGREEFRRALQSAMPKLLTNGSKTPKDQMLEILDGTTAKAWKKDAARLRALVACL